MLFVLTQYFPVKNRIPWNIFHNLIYEVFLLVSFVYITNLPAKRVI